MGHTKILVRLLGEAVDCWRPVDAVKNGHLYQIVGPEPDPEEEWEFQVGEVVQCGSRDGQLVATQLVRSGAPWRCKVGEATHGAGAWLRLLLARSMMPIRLACWRAARRQTNTLRK
jgi:hypothetical protein